MNFVIQCATKNRKFGTNYLIVGVLLQLFETKDRNLVS